MSEWITAEWQTGMPVIVVKEGRKVVSRVPVDASADSVPDGAGALLWAMIRTVSE